MFGVEESNKVEIWSSDVSIRIDVRDPDFMMATLLLEIAQDHGCFLVSKDDGRPMAPDMRVFIDALNGSRAAKFLRDPAGFLGRF